MKWLIFMTIFLTSFELRADKVALLDNGDDIFEFKMQIVDNPVDDLFCADFIYRNDETSKIKLAGLIDAAKKGVRSLNIVDAPTMMLDPAYLYVAQEAGVEFRLFNPMGHKKFNGHKRFHKKLTLTKGLWDTGGTNTGDEYHGRGIGLSLNDRDTAIMGDSWKEAHRQFLVDWESDWVRPAKVVIVSKEEKEAYLAKLMPKAEGMKKKIDVLEKITPITLDAPDLTRGSGIQYVTQEEVDAARSELSKIRKDWLAKQAATAKKNFFKNSSPNAQVEIYGDVAGKKGKAPGTGDALIDLLNSAKKSITVSTPYFILTKGMKKALEDAIARGVKVTIITNSLMSSDNPMTQLAYELNYDKAAKIGFDLYEYNGPATNHAKNVIIDDSYTSTGYNWDPRSQDLNMESIARIKNDPKGLAAMQDSLLRTMGDSTLVAQNGKSLIVKQNCTTLFERFFMKVIEHQL